MIIYQVDAFTNKAFTGNPAGVCILEREIPDSLMQSLAMEMNLSETAFLLRRCNGEYDLRWFTPAAEVDLCGHATLASAHILWETASLSPGEEARFHTRSGLLTAKKKNDWIELDFPREEDQEVKQYPTELNEAFHDVKFLYVGKNRMDYIVELENERIIRQLAPDFNVLAKIPTRGVIITSSADSEEYDFVSRFFAPAYGISEDPVTGSAHCCLGPYWQKRTGKSSFSAYQASARGGIIKLEIAGERVILSGQAVTVMSAEVRDHL